MVADMKGLRLSHSRQNFVGPFGVVLMPMRLGDQFFLSSKMPLAFLSIAFRFRKMLRQRSSIHLTPYRAANSPYGGCAALIFSLEIHHAVGVRESGWICLP